MSQDKTLAKNFPSWLWLAFCPIIGGFAFIYAGKKNNQKEWIYTGIGFALISIVTLSSGISILIWLGQIGLAFYWKGKYLKIADKSDKSDQLPLPISTRLRTIDTKGKIDINTCTKDELVYRLGLPIVYANEIIEIRESGLVLTHIEELSEFTSLPVKYLSSIESNVMFTYDSKQECQAKWENVNFFSESDLIALGLSEVFSKTLVNERMNSGHYQSLLDVTRRTKIPIRYLQQIL